MVSVKSGWDEYGISFGRPSFGITIRRVTGSNPFAGFSIGSKTSGGIENVLVENLNLYNTGISIHIKTNAGRGGEHVYLSSDPLSHGLYTTKLKVMEGPQRINHFMQS